MNQASMLSNHVLVTRALAPTYSFGVILRKKLTDPDRAEHCCYFLMNHSIAELSALSDVAIFINYDNNEIMVRPTGFKPVTFAIEGL